jgi:hypothetical protein
MPGYKELYDYCQTLQPKVSRRHILRKTLEITGIDQVKSIKTSLDIEKCRGFFLSANNTEHRIVQQLGKNVIVLARDLNYCWERFVFTKELMHLFDNDQEKTDSSEKFNDLLTEFELLQPMEKRSGPFNSDIEAFWKALACLCPEKNRLEYVATIDKGHLDHYGVALQLRIPRQYVHQLFHPNFKQIVDVLLEK